MKVKTLLKQLLFLLLIVALFAAFNGSAYLLLTRRLGNNFSGADQYKMIDVARYLPHTAESDLVRIDASISLSGELPVLDGAAALVPVYAAFIDALYPEGCVTFEGGSFSDDNLYGENFAADSKMQYQNSLRGYTALVDGKTDVFFSAAPSEAQKQYAAEQGVELTYVPIGLEAFVFFVNENNPVNDLSAEQIRCIYEGTYQNWSQVGGKDRLINIITRPEGSGSQSAMNAFMGRRQIGRKPLLAITGASIGYSFRYYLDGIVDNKAVKMLSLNGVYPDKENIQNGSYPLVTEFYAVYRTDNKNENVPLLIDWILSEEGQSVIEESGYVRIKS